LGIMDEGDVADSADTALVDTSEVLGLALSVFVEDCGGVAFSAIAIGAILDAVESQESALSLGVEGEAGFALGAGFVCEGEAVGI
jgi:hypothetical protein